MEDMSLYFAELTGDDSLLEAERKVVGDRERTGGVEMTSTSPSQEPLSTGEVT